MVQQKSECRSTTLNVKIFLGAFETFCQANDLVEEVVWQTGVSLHLRDNRRDRREIWWERCAWGENCLTIPHSVFCRNGRLFQTSHRHDLLRDHTSSPVSHSHDPPILHSFVSHNGWHRKAFSWCQTDSYMSCRFKVNIYGVSGGMRSILPSLFSLTHKHPFKW